MIFAQLPENLKFENYTMKNGLPNNMVWGITQDKYGFLWIATVSGLSRFDGVKFTNFFSGADSNSLRSNEVMNVRADHDGRVWIISNGLCYYDYANNDFKYIQLPGKKIEWISSIAPDSKNSLWFFSNLGLCRVDVKTLQPALVNDRLPAKIPTSLFIDPSDRVWFSQCDNGFFMYDPATKHLNNLANSPDHLNECFDHLFSDKKDELWLVNSYGEPGVLKRFDVKAKKSETFFSFLHSKNISEHFIHVTTYPYLTGDSILWCNNSHALELFNRKTKKFTGFFENIPQDETGLPSEHLRVKFIDRDNNLWIAGNGIIKLNPNNQQISSYKIGEMFNRKIPVSIRKIIPCKNEQHIYWLITYGGGILKYDLARHETIKWYRYTPPGKNFEDANGSWNYDGLYDREGKLWIASGIGLSYYDEKNDRFGNIHFFPDSVKRPNVVLKIAEGNHHDLWLATTFGLWQYNILSGHFKKINGINEKVQSSPPEEN